jgi:hypothetical protein
MTIASTLNSNFASNLTKTAAAFVLLSLSACGALPDDNTTQGQALSASAPSLGAAASFAVLGASTVTCTGGSAITGNVGVSPSTGITGFNPPCTVAGSIDPGDALAVQAHADLATAYDGLAAAACEHNLTGQELGGQTLTPGVYCFDSTAGLTGALTLDAGGDSTATWIFQMGTALTTATNASVVMAGGAKPGNVFWKVGSAATIGTATAFQGNLVAYATITMVSGSSLVGRALAVHAAVTLDNNHIALGN